jgi:ActR/RegA family two-component response regulator
MRRLFVALVLLSVLVTGTGVALAFLATREAVPTAGPDRAALLTAYAQSRLGDLFHRSLDAAAPRLDAARDSPLVEADGVLLVDGGVQLLPRLWSDGPETGSKARAIYDAFKQGNVMLIEDDSAWSQRLALALEVRGATFLGDQHALETTLRTFLAHRARTDVERAEDLPLMISVLDLVTEKGETDSSLLGAVLREGYSEPGAGSVEGVEEGLLRAREEMSKSDFDFLVARVDALAAATKVPHDDFDARVAESSGDDLDLKPVDEPTLLGGWYLEPGANASLRGVRIDPVTVMKTVQAEMLAAGFLLPGDVLTLPPIPQTAIGLTQLRPTITSPVRPAADSARQHRLQQALGLALAGCVATLLFALGVLLTSRSSASG